MKLIYFQVITGNQTLPTATVKIKKGRKIYQEASVGDGPIDATYKAIDRITGLSPKLLDYSLKAVTSGKEALGEVTVKIKEGEWEVMGRGVSTDVIEASARAYINALNRLLYRKERFSS